MIFETLLVLHLPAWIGITPHVVQAARMPCRRNGQKVFGQLVMLRVTPYSVGSLAPIVERSKVAEIGAPIVDPLALVGALTLSVGILSSMGFMGLQMRAQESANRIVFAKRKVAALKDLPAYSAEELQEREQQVQYFRDQLAERRQITLGPVSFDVFNPLGVGSSEQLERSTKDAGVDALQQPGRPRQLESMKQQLEQQLQDQELQEKQMQRRIANKESTRNLINAILAIAAFFAPVVVIFLMGLTTPGVPEMVYSQIFKLS